MFIKILNTPKGIKKPGNTGRIVVTVTSAVLTVYMHATPVFAASDWLTGKIMEWQGIIKLVFGLVAAVVATVMLAQRKMLGIVMLIVAVVLLGWLVYDAQGAYTTISPIFK